MRHARPDYNHLQDPTGDIPIDEPVFLIRGQDLSSGDTVRAWADLNDERGGDPDLSKLARAHADEMDAWEPKKPADGPTHDGLTRPTFQAELEALINRYSVENESDTPDFILAAYLRGCLVNFAVAVRHREEWYGRGRGAIEATEMPDVDTSCDDTAEDTP